MKEVRPTHSTRLNSSSTRQRSPTVSPHQVPQAYFHPRTQNTTGSKVYESAAKASVRDALMSCNALAEQICGTAGVN